MTTDGYGRNGRAGYPDTLGYDPESRSMIDSMIEAEREWLATRKQYSDVYERRDGMVSNPAGAIKGRRRFIAGAALAAATAGGLPRLVGAAAPAGAV